MVLRLLSRSIILVPDTCLINYFLGLDEVMPYASFRRSG